MGWRLAASQCVELEPNEQGWLWSEEIGLWLGTWQGEFQRVTATWLRFYSADGLLIATRVEAEAQRAQAEAQRAEAAEAEIARLRALLAKHSISEDNGATD